MLADVVVIDMGFGYIVALSSQNQSDGILVQCYI